MSDRALRYLVATAIALLLVYQVGALIAGLFGLVWGVAASVLVAAVSFASARLARAGGQSSFWFLLPTIVFTVGPMAMAVWNVATRESTWFDRVVGLAPFLVGFALPIILLAAVYYELRSRTLPAD